MSVVQQVLEMLRAHISAFEFDDQGWMAQARREAGVPPAGPDDRKQPGQTRRKASARRRPSPRTPPRARRRKSRTRGPGGAHRTSSGKPRADGGLKRFYAQLEIPYGAGFDEVRSAWKSLVRQHHPDLHATDPERSEATTELVKIYNNAYDELRKRLLKAT